MNFESDKIFLRNLFLAKDLEMKFVKSLANGYENNHMTI